MRWVVPVMASIRRSTRGLGDNAEHPPAFLEIASDQQPEAAGQLGDAYQRAMIGAVLLVQPPIGGFRPSGGRHDARRERADIAADSPPLRRGHEVKIGAGTQRPVLDRADQPEQAASPIDVADFADFRVHRGGDLLGDQPARIPGEIAQQRGGKQRKQKQIDQRQAKRRGADQFTECGHSSNLGGLNILRWLIAAKSSCFRKLPKVTIRSRKQVDRLRTPRGRH
jgi:hypothetical protein